MINAENIEYLYSRLCDLFRSLFIVVSDATFISAHRLISRESVVNVVLQTRT